MFTKSPKKLSILTLLLMLFISGNLNAHCDTIDGPVVKAAVSALETGNVNYVLMWIQENDEQVIKDMFQKVLKVRQLSNEAKELADNYFFETVVRVHRMGEGVAYTGIKPAGSEVDKGILAADAAIENNSIEYILKEQPEENHEIIINSFNRLQSLKNYDVNDLTASREYVKSYVHFIHYIEEISASDDHSNSQHMNHKKEHIH